MAHAAQPMLLPSGLPRHVADEEELARFLTSSKQFTAKMAKPVAFLPNPKNAETSVFRHLVQPHEQLWQLGRSYLGEGRTVHGAAILTAAAIREATLDVQAQEPPPRHANIVGWPVAADDPVLTKARQKEVAAVLASSARLVRP